MKRLLVTPEHPDGILEDYTAEEEALAISIKEKFKKEDADMKIALEQKATDKISGNQKLKDLGLTDDEIAALMG